MTKQINKAEQRAVQARNDHREERCYLNLSAREARYLKRVRARAERRAARMAARTEGY